MDAGDRPVAAMLCSKVADSVPGMAAADTPVSVALSVSAACCASRPWLVDGHMGRIKVLGSGSARVELAKLVALGSRALAACAMEAGAVPESMTVAWAAGLGVALAPEKSQWMACSFRP